MSALATGSPDRHVWDGVNPRRTPAQVIARGRPAGISDGMNVAISSIRHWSDAKPYKPGLVSVR